MSYHSTGAGLSVTFVLFCRSEAHTIWISANSSSHNAQTKYTAVLCYVFIQCGIQCSNCTATVHALLNSHKDLCFILFSLPSPHPHEHRVNQSQCRTLSSWPWRWRGWCSMVRPQGSSERSSQSAWMSLRFSRARRGRITRYAYCSKCLYLHQKMSNKIYHAVIIC